MLPIGREERLKEIHSYSCLFVYIRGSSLSTPPVSLSNDPPVVGAGTRLVRNVAESPGNPMVHRNSGFEERTLARFEIFFGHPIAFEYDGRFRIEAQGRVGLAAPDPGPDPATAESAGAAPFFLARDGRKCEPGTEARFGASGCFLEAVFSGPMAGNCCSPDRFRPL